MDVSRAHQTLSNQMPENNRRRWRRGAFVKTLLKPRFLLPTLLSAGLIAFFLSLTNGKTVSRELADAVPRTAVPAFLLTLVYLVGKGIQWKLYLARLGIRPGWSGALVPYAGGELGNSLPMGVFLENYLLKGSAGSSIGRSSAATTWILITESIVCLLALLVVGVPGWPWVRLLAVGMLAGMILTGLFLFKLPLAQRALEQWRQRARRTRPLAEGLWQFLDGSKQLFVWQTVLFGLPLAALYLGAQVTVLYLIGSALHPDFGWHTALAAFSFSLGAVLLLPVLPHLGSMEATGVGVIMQFGMTTTVGAASLLALRLLTTGAMLVIVGGGALLLHRQVGRVLRGAARAQRAPAREERWEAAEDEEEERAA